VEDTKGRRTQPPQMPPPRRPKAMAESSLLSELAGEAADVAGRGQEVARESDDLAQRVHGALRRIFRFFGPFCEHANVIAPEIRRSYRLDTRTAYANLHWCDAYVSSRNQQEAVDALVDHVTFSVRLRAPEPVVITRRWDQLQGLERELRILNLHAIDDLSMIGKAKQEWHDVRVTESIPVLMRFTGRYDEGRIDVLASNIDGFGIAAFEIALSDVTPELLDGLGRFLIGRSNTLPKALRRLRDPVDALKVIAPSAAPT
jgi:hypothetical protein